MKSVAVSSIFLVLSCLATGALAQEPGRCKVINWKPNRVYSVRAALHHGTHIILPEPMLGGPITGNQDLWSIEGQGTHLFAKPTTKEAEGTRTTVTIIGQSNKSYEFVLNRVNSNPDICVQVETGGDFLKDNTLASYRSPEDQLAMLMQEKIANLESQLAAERVTSAQKAKQVAEESLQKYRTHIYTRYEWTKGSGFMGQDLVSDVWDDGRFTYVRVFGDNKGLLTVTAEVDGEKEFIDYKYDSDNKIYKVSGIFPEFEMKYGKSTVEVEREDSASNGSY